MRRFKWLGVMVHFLNLNLLLMTHTNQIGKSGQNQIIEFVYERCNLKFFNVDTLGITLIKRIALGSHICQTL